MTDERELKLALVDRAALIRRLESEGARRLAAESFEENRVWDRADDLRASGRLLRLRRDGQGVRLTYKGPARFEGGVKVRIEHETAVGDEESMAAILTALGYRLVRRYQKYREQWQLENVVIALDRTPIGDFVEFEGAAASAVATRCGCDPATALEADYLTLYARYRERHPQAPEEMIFPTSGGADG